MLRGSSPLARGLLVGAVLDMVNVRIIPARAGFTELLAGLMDGDGDHPRSRGVYGNKHYGPLCPRGSSPLARGLLDTGPHDQIEGRIIPARAGFTIGVRGSGRWRWDHPRSRGVYPEGGYDVVVLHGSSPLARGLLAPVVVHRGDAGIIPARAGFTPK